MIVLASENEIWEMAKVKLQENLNFSNVSMRLWFDSMTLKVLTEDTAYFSVDEDLKKKVIQTRYLDDIKAAVAEILGFEVKIVPISTEKDTFENCLADILYNENQEKNTPSVIPPVQTPTYRRMDNSYLSSEIRPIDDDLVPGQVLVSPSFPDILPEYTFENFVVGSSNKLAYTTARTVAQNPSDKTYNPLFIYGDPGLGKTHLLHAITREIVKNYPTYNILRVKGEDFTNELIESLAIKAPVQFREKYRKADVLVVDDIQFIAGKVSVQEEFFHTFDALFESGKQIIVSSDRPPKDMKTLETRLKSRFEMGFIVDIQAPDLELRVAILKRKAQNLGIKVPNDVLMYLGENIKDNVRQIEGALKKMRALAFIQGKDIDMEHAKVVVNDVLTSAAEAVTPEKIVTYISQKFGIPEEDIKSSKRSKSIVSARHLVVYFMRTMLDMTYPIIGKYFNRDHTTIMSSVANVESEIKRSLEFENMINEIRRDIKSGNIN